MEHYFKPKSKDSRNNKEQQIWRCDRCDSEVIMKTGRSKEYVNKYMIEFFTKMKCLPQEAFKES